MGCAVRAPGVRIYRRGSKFSAVRAAVRLDLAEEDSPMPQELLDLRCAGCGEPLQEPPEPKRDSTVTCRRCGQSEQLEEARNRAIQPIRSPP